MTASRQSGRSRPRREHEGNLARGVKSKRQRPSRRRRLFLSDWSILEKYQGGSADRQYAHVVVHLGDGVGADGFAQFLRSWLSPDIQVFMSPTVYDRVSLVLGFAQGQMVSVLEFFWKESIDVSQLRAWTQWALCSFSCLSRQSEAASLLEAEERCRDLVFAQECPSSCELSSCLRYSGKLSCVVPLRPLELEQLRQKQRDLEQKQRDLEQRVAVLEGTLLTCFSRQLGFVQGQGVGPFVCPDELGNGVTEERFRIGTPVCGTEEILKFLDEDILDQSCGLVEECQEMD